MGNQCGDRGGRNQNGQFVECRQIERYGRSRRRTSNKAEQRQPGRQADGNDNDANALHDRNRAQVGAEFGAERQDLRHSTRRGRQICVDLAPPMDQAQVPRAADRNDSHCEQQHGDAERIGRHTVQRFRRVRPRRAICRSAQRSRASSTLEPALAGRPATPLPRPESNPTASPQARRPAPKRHRPPAQWRAFRRGGAGPLCGYRLSGADNGQGSR